MENINNAYIQSRYRPYLLLTKEEPIDLSILKSKWRKALSFFHPDKGDPKVDEYKAEVIKLGGTVKEEYTVEDYRNWIDRSLRGLSTNEIPSDDIESKDITREMRMLELEQKQLKKVKEQEAKKIKGNNPLL